MRPFSLATVAGESANALTPQLISPAASDVYQQADAIHFVAAFGSLTDLITPLAPLPPIAKVEFFDGVVKLGESTTFPWFLSFAANGLSTGAHSVKCRVTYTSGVQRTSSSVSITVAAAPATNAGSFAAVKLWGDYSDGANLTPSNPTPGTLISACGNKQGTSVFANLAQATSANQPTVDFIRGVPCVMFGTGTQQHMDSAITGTVAQPWQVSMPFRLCGPGTTGTVFAGTTGGNFKVNGAGDWPMNAALDANVTISFATAFPNSISHTMQFQASASGFINQDGNVLVSATTGSRTLQTTFAVGAGSTGTAATSCGITEIAVSTGLSTTDQATQRNALIAKTHTSEPAATEMQVGDSLIEGFGSTNGFGDRYMVWLGVNGVKWSYAKAKVAGKWSEQQGPVQTGASSRFGWIDDQSYWNSGKGLNFCLANLPARIGPGNPYNPKYMQFEFGAANAQNKPGETYVPGIGAGTTNESLILQAGVAASAGIMFLIVVNLIDSNPAFGTGPNSTWFNIRDYNSLFPYAIAQMRSRYGVTVVPLDLFNFLGPWSSSRWFDDVHLNDTGYAVRGQAYGQAKAQMQKLLP